MSNYLFEIGERNYPIEDCYIFGSFEDGYDKQVQWNIVVEFPGEDVHASFENITLKNVNKFEDLENKAFILEEHDLEEEFLYEGIDEDFIYVDEIHFGKINKENQTIDIEVLGIAADEFIESDINDEEEIEGEELNIHLNAQFEGIYFFTENKKNVEKFVKNYLKKELSEVKIEFEKEEDDDWWNCIITY